MESTAAKHALKNFAQKMRPTGLPIWEMEDAPGGPGVVELTTLLSRAFSKMEDSDVTPEEVLFKPFEFDWLIKPFSQFKPLTLDDPDVDVIIRLCDLQQLERLVRDLGPEEQRDCFLRAGYYDQAKAIDGWSNFAEKPFPYKDFYMRELGLTNEVAYGLCQRMQQFGVVGNALSMVGLYRDVAQIAKLSLGGESPIVLIEGERGSGKGAIAKAIHDLGGREGRFYRLNVSAISEHLVESALFGHRKGAFTGATDDQDGWFEACSNNGTLVLDDINYLAEKQRPKLLQVLEERTFTKVGDVDPISGAGAMIVVTSNQSLATLEGFQTDLLERINQHVVQVPDVLFRVSDIPNLVRHFVDQQSGIKEASKYRFQIARKLRQWGQEDRLSVRTIRNEIGSFCRESQGDLAEVLKVHDHHVDRVLGAILRLCPNGEPVKKSQVAAELGIGKSTLSDTSTKFGNAWTVLEANGEIPGWDSENCSEAGRLPEHDP